VTANDRQKTEYTKNKHEHTANKKNTHATYLGDRQANAFCAVQYNK